MYTKFDFNFHLSKETPSSVVKTIEAMLSENSFQSLTLRDKPFRWAFMFNNSSNIEYFNGITQVRVRGEIKNYEDEIELFLDMVKPWLEERGVTIGTTHYEEFVNPTTVVVELDGSLSFIKHPEPEDE